MTQINENHYDESLRTVCKGKLRRLIGTTILNHITKS